MQVLGPDSGTAIIANPTAGTITATLIDEVERRCARDLRVLGVHTTGHRGHASELAAALDVRAVRTVVAIGGDGTANEIITGLSRFGADAPALIVVPAGTGNSLYREIWGVRGQAEALDVALDARRSRVRLLDLARFAGTGTSVLLGAASGLVADALVTARDIRDVSGWDRYGLAIAKTLTWFKPYQGRVLVDGVEVHQGSTILANVGGGRYRGGRHKLLPQSILDDGLLDVCVIDGALDPRELPGLTVDGGHVGRPEVVYRRGRQVTVERTDGEPLSFEHDGEYFTGKPTTSFTLDVVPHAVAVRAPLG